MCILSYIYGSYSLELGEDIDLPVGTVSCARELPESVTDAIGSQRTLSLRGSECAVVCLQAISVR